MEKIEKEWLYVGYYHDVNNNFVLKIGTTNDLKRRQQEHTRNYRKAAHNPAPPDETFHYIWTLPLSKWNTHRYEESNIKFWQEMEIGEFVRNDRFVLQKIPNFVPVKIRKTYQIALV